MSPSEIEIKCALDARGFEQIAQAAQRAAFSMEEFGRALGKVVIPITERVERPIVERAIIDPLPRPIRMIRL